MKRKVVTHIRLLTLVTLAIGIGGCQSGPGKALSNLSESFQPLRTSWRQVNDFPSNVEFAQWQWDPGIPRDVERAELLSAVVPGSDMRNLVADIPGQEIALVSANGMREQFRIVNVNGTEIETCDDLFGALERLPRETARNVQVDVLATRGGIKSSRETAVVVDQTTLKALVNRVHSENSNLKITDGDHAWLVHRSPDLQLKLTARVERHRGLMQLVVTMDNISGQPLLMPRDVSAFCNGQAVKCLTVAETLEVLYGDPAWSENDLTSEQTSFAVVSERDDFLLPTNFKRLDAAMTERFQQQAQSPPSPALASIPGEVFPGSAVLGDGDQGLSQHLRGQRLHDQRPSRSRLRLS